MDFYYSKSDIIYKKLNLDNILHQDCIKNEPNYSQTSLGHLIDLSLNKFVHDFPYENLLNTLVLGCGLGSTCRYLLRKGMNIDGIDISEGAIYWAKYLSKKFEMKGGEKKGQLKFIKDDFLEYLGQNNYDLIIDDHFLHCLAFERERDLYMKQVSKYLKKNGKFIFETLIYEDSLQKIAEKSHFSLICDINEVIWKNNEPFRKAIRTEILEGDLIRNGFKIEYFIIFKSLKFVLDESLNLGGSMVKVICSKNVY